MTGELLLDAGMARRAPLSGGPLHALLAAIALLAVLLPTLVVLSLDRARPYRDVVALPRRVVPRTEVPPVEPVRLVDLAPDAARAYNAQQPFVDGAVVAARPFRFAGSADDLARATDCLAAGEIYEAGDDTTGERAVAQVVLNRLRHPAFPKTVCGVVFEGSDRTTGCQFTFSCDGALARWHPTEAAWKRAREVATAALAGNVDARVGYATHYHTDWVVPYWQASLDKIARVGTHLFFRWAGWWGTPPAFDRHATGVEPVVAKLAVLSSAHAATDAATATATAADGALTPGVAFFGKSLRPLANDPDTFLTALPPMDTIDSYRALAQQACGERPRCKVLGWTDVGAMAFTLPLSPEAQAALSFSYLRDRATGFDKALWNCEEFKRVPAGGCMKRVAASRPVATEATDTTATPEPARGPDDLDGVRRKSAMPSRPITSPGTSPAATP